VINIKHKIEKEKKRKGERCYWPNGRRTQAFQPQKNATGWSQKALPF
jgi:hypothetical protein